VPYNPFMGGGKSRSGVTPSNKGSRNLLKPVVMGAVARTSPGSIYALRALHPCDETLSGGERIPDLTTAETCALETRLWASIVAPELGADQSSWDCLMIIPAVPDLPLTYLVRATGDAWPFNHGGLPPFKEPGALKFLEFPTIPLQAGGLGDPASTVKGPTLCNYADSYRMVYKGVTVVMDCASLTNNGTVYSAQWLQELNIPQLDAGLEYYSCANVPSDPQSLFAKCAQTTEWRAKEGIYMPMRYSQPVHEYLETSSNVNLRGFRINLAGQGGQVGNAAYYTPDKQIPGPVVPPATPTFAPVGVSPPGNMHLGVIYWSGLSKTTSLQLKIRQGLQAVPVSSGPWGAFIETAPEPDTRAVESVIRVQNGLQLAYPERYNSLGMLMGVIGPLLARAASWLAPKVGGWLTGLGKRAEGATLHAGL